MWKMWITLWINKGGVKYGRFSKSTMYIRKWIQ